MKEQRPATFREVLLASICHDIEQMNNHQNLLDVVDRTDSLAKNNGLDPASHKTLLAATHERTMKLMKARR